MSEKFVGYIKRQGTSKFYPLFTNNGEQSIWLGFEYDADKVSEVPSFVGEFYLDENGVPTVELEDTDVTVNKLKPCPFCGSEAEECFDDEGNVQCSNCDCQMGMATVCPSVWNTRPLEDKLEAEVAELKPYRDGYDADKELPDNEENVIVNVGACLYLAHYGSGEWHDSLSGQKLIRGSVKRWWKLPEVEK